jgi:hypothetical protein
MGGLVLQTIPTAGEKEKKWFGTILQRIAQTFVEYDFDWNRNESKMKMLGGKMINADDESSEGDERTALRQEMTSDIDVGAPFEDAIDRGEDLSLGTSTWKARHGLVVVSKKTVTNTHLILFGRTLTIPGFAKHTRSNAEVTLPLQHLRLLALAKPFVQDHPELRSPARVLAHAQRSDATFGRDMVVRKMTSLPGIRERSIRGLVPDMMWTLVALCYANLLYAGVHLLAWHGPFRTEVEMILWRFTALSLAWPAYAGIIGGLLGLLGVLVMNGLVRVTSKDKGLTFRDVLRSMWVGNDSSAGESGLEDTDAEAMDTTFKFWNTAMTEVRILKQAQDIFDGKSTAGEAAVVALKLSPLLLLLGPLFVVGWILMMIVGPILAAYTTVLGRPFIIVESFVALPFSPLEVYESIDWTYYWPHVS